MRYVTGLAGALAPLLLGAGLVAAGAASAQDADYAYVGATLFGKNEVGHEGAGEDASGDFNAELDLTNGKICYLLEVEGLDEVVAAHIHEGREGSNGAPVMSLQLASDNGDDVCVDADKELLKRIARRSDGYYVNVHTKAFPEGAVRGQLGK